MMLKTEAKWIGGLGLIGTVLGFFLFGTSLMNRGDMIFMAAVAAVLILCGLMFVALTKRQDVSEATGMYFKYKARVIYLIAGGFLGIAVSPGVLNMLGLVWER